MASNLKNILTSSIVVLINFLCFWSFLECSGCDLWHALDCVRIFWHSCTSWLKISVIRVLLFSWLFWDCDRRDGIQMCSRDLCSCFEFKCLNCCLLGLGMDCLKLNMHQLNSSVDALWVVLKGEKRWILSMTFSAFRLPEMWISIENYEVLSIALGI